MLTGQDSGRLSQQDHVCKKWQNDDILRTTAGTTKTTLFRGENTSTASMLLLILSLSFAR